MPDIGDSGADHWQSLWEKRNPRFKRVHQRDWTRPIRVEWVGTLGRTISEYAGDMVLVAHGLACLMVAHWTMASQPRMRGRVRAAFLAAPVDPSTAAYQSQAAGFNPVPLFPLPFPSLVVASTNDSRASVAFAAGLAHAWDSRCEIVGPRGHLDEESNLWDWPEGSELLDDLVRQTGADVLS